MRISLKDQHILVTGAVPGMDRADVERALHRAGASCAAGPTESVCYTVVGAKPGQKTLERSRSLGLPELSADQLIALLRDGYLDLDEAQQAPVVPMAEAIPELRGLFDGPPTPESWAELTAIIDAAPADRAAALITEAEPLLSGWSLDPVRRWWCSMTAWRAPESQSWLAGDLRRAPLAWMHELLQGSYHPKHSLIRAISLEHTKANASMGAALLSSPHLTNVRVLDTGRDLKLAAAFFKKLAAASAKELPALDTLIYYPLKLGGGPELAKAALPRLKHLHLRAIVYSTSNDSSLQDMDALFGAPWLGQIETLEASMGTSDGWYRLASPYPQLKAHAQRLTSLKRLILHDTSYLSDLIDSPICDQIEEIILCAEGDDSLSMTLRALDQRSWPALKRLDVSQNLWPNAQHKKSRFRPQTDTLVSTVRPSKLAKQVTEIVVGPHASDAIRAAFAADSRAVI